MRKYSSEALQICGRTVSAWNRLSGLSQRRFVQYERYDPVSPPRDNGGRHYNASQIAMRKQSAAFQQRSGDSKNRLSKKRKIGKTDGSLREGTHEEILTIEAFQLLSLNHRNGPSADDVEDASAGTDKADKVTTIGPGDEIQAEVKELSSTGDGLAISKSGDLVYVVPFAVPGDVVRAKIAPSYFKGNSYALTDFIEVVKPSPQRDDSQIKCRYFSKCAGCQLQMLPYEAQLAHKKSIVEKAFKNFSGLAPDQIPAPQDTMGSPMQYSYRTKLTPHFDGPNRGGGKNSKFTSVPDIGFSIKGRKKVMDIENCPIGTDVVQEGLKYERARVAREITSYKHGATLLLRESTQRTASTNPPSPPKQSSAPTSTLTQTPTGAPLLTITTPTHTDHKTCTTSMNAFTTEYIDSFTFTSRAGSFFQNNNSILSPFTAYIRTHIHPPILDPSAPPIKYLLDAYCGSGLFSITLSSLFTSVLGIDIDPAGIVAARTNASANKISNTGFIEADASALFADVPFPPAQTVVVIDPPRKGASEDFLRQLMRFGPKRVVYVSCNVHTQARDVGFLVNGLSGLSEAGEGAGGESKEKQWKYDIESLRGFDFFPQTGHVEGVAFLNREHYQKHVEDVAGNLTTAFVEPSEEFCRAKRPSSREMRDWLKLFGKAALVVFLNQGEGSGYPGESGDQSRIGRSIKRQDVEKAAVEEQDHEYSRPPRALSLQN